MKCARTASAAQTRVGGTAAAPPAGIVSAVPFGRPCWSRYLRTDLEGSAHTRTPRGESPQKAENWGMIRKVAKPTMRSLDRRSETSNRGSFLLTAQGRLSTLLSLKVFLWQGNCGNQLLSYPTRLGLIPENQLNNSSEEYISQEEAPKRVRWMSFCFFSQFSSVAQSRLTLCNPMDCNTPGFPVHHQLPEFTQTHAHWIGDAIQPSHPLSSPSPLAFNLSQHQGLFEWVSSHQMAKAPYKYKLPLSLERHLWLLFTCSWGLLTVQPEAETWWSHFSPNFPCLLLQWLLHFC